MSRIFTPRRVGQDAEESLQSYPFRSNKCLMAVRTLDPRFVSTESNLRFREIYDKIIPNIFGIGPYLDFDGIRYLSTWNSSKEVVS